MRWNLWSRHRSKPVVCSEHHWHYSGWGWRCCHGEHGLKVRNDHPGDTTDECAERPNQFDELQSWLKSIATGPTSVRARHRRARAAA